MKKEVSVSKFACHLAMLITIYEEWLQRNETNVLQDVVAFMHPNSAISFKVS